MKYLFSHWVVGVALVAVFALALQFPRNEYGEPYADWVHNKTFDWYQRLSPRLPAPEKMPVRVAIIDIDEASLKTVGQWPWSRRKIAELVEKLTAYGVSVIGFDMIFSEPDRTSPRLFLGEHPELPETVTTALSQLPDNEHYLAEAIRTGRVVLGQIGVNETVADITRKVGYGYKSPDKDKLILPMLGRYAGLVRNRPELEEAAAGVGLFSTRPDADGVFRRIALIEQVGDKTYPSLSLEMLRVALGGTDDYLIKGYKDKAGVQSVVVKTASKKQHYEIPTDEHGRVWVHFARYGADSPIYISAKDVLEGTVQDAGTRLKGAIVVIGTSAAGLKDIRNTPINGNLPGVEMHVQLLETVLSSAHLTRPFLATEIELGFIVIGGLLLVFFVPRVRASLNLVLCALLIGGLFYIARYYYLEKRVLVDAVYPALAIFTLFITLSYMNYMREEKERKKVKTAFGHYVSPALLEEIARNPDKLKLGGETRNITLMFSDIRGFTTISEQFTAEGLTQFINSYLTPMTDIIMRGRGTIDKYMGDAIMAFWNAPLDDPDHALNACRAALAMQEALKSLNEELRAKAEREQKKYIPIHIGIGLNTGDCCVGNMGSTQRFDYSALGDDVNLASRLEGQSKTYGVEVVVGENTARKLGGTMALLELDLIQVKGKTEPVTIYALLGDEGFKTSSLFHNATEIMGGLLAAYRNQKWSDAEANARKLGELTPLLATLSQLYIERIAAYRHTPPPSGWRGEYIATSK